MATEMDEARRTDFIVGMVKGNPSDTKGIFDAVRGELAYDINFAAIGFRLFYFPVTKPTINPEHDKENIPVRLAYEKLLRQIYEDLGGKTTLTPKEWYNVWGFSAAYANVLRDIDFKTGEYTPEETKNRVKKSIQILHQVLDMESVPEGVDDMLRASVRASLGLAYSTLYFDCGDRNPEHLNKAKAFLEDAMKNGSSEGKIIAEIELARLLFREGKEDLMGASFEHTLDVKYADGSALRVLADFGLPKAERYCLKTKRYPGIEAKYRAEIAKVRAEREKLKERGRGE